MTHYFISRATSARARLRGFTLVELLVVITIIGMLVALLLPAVQSARATAQRTECLNNIRNLATAAIGYETDKQRLPGYVEPVKRTAALYAVVLVPTSATALGGSTIDESNARGESFISWAGHLAPYMELQPVWDSLQDTTVTSGVPRSAIKPAALLLCPSDTELTSLSDNAGMTYVANTGAWDYDSSSTFLSGSNRGDTKANGLFHNRTQGSIKVQMTDIADGASTTLLFSENIHRNTQYCWLGVGAGSSAGTLPEAHYGMVWINGSEQPANLISSNESDQSDIYFQALLGQEVGVNFQGRTPFYARPSSGHPGGSFNVAFADGHGRALDPDLDPIVYQQLLAPNNRKCVNPEDHTNYDNSPILEYRNAAPLSAVDFE